MKFFNDLSKNKSFVTVKTLLLFLLVSLLVFSVSCSNTSKSIEPISSRQNDVDITEALPRAIDVAFNRVPKDAIIAIVHVAAPNQALYDFLTGEIEHILVLNGYDVTDRRQLDQIRTERDFQLSWEVDETTAVSIGRFVGADAVITGSVDGEGSLQRLRIRVLNTETARVIGTGSEPFATTLALTETPEDLTASQTINITSFPSGANIYIYDRNNNIVFHGTTPAEASLNTFLNTNYLVVFSREGYQNFEQNINNIDRRLEPTRVHATLTQVPVQSEVQTTQTINITSNPSDASVLIYNQAGNVVFTGRTPANTSLNTIVNTSYLVIISRDGYVNNEQTIRIVNGRLERDRVSVSLERVPTPPITQTPPPPTQTTPPATTQLPSSVRVGDIITFGRYQWRVLEVQENRVLIITQDIIERREYDTSRFGITWANCSLRAYLNGEFYNSFNPTDRARIVLTDVQNPNNPTYGTAGGVTTRDRIFLLSIQEAQRYFSSNSDRIALFNGQAYYWWLRSPGDYTHNASYVDHGGLVNLLGYRIVYGRVGVRPALWLSL
ncbi:MAG: DUF6273 domain-containing protein [Candidatus Cloacimonetes bacterium]|nr:DUF6273 domain-containing protein [Candidatus Cloacimonadota bacterium]